MEKIDTRQVVVKEGEDLLRMVVEFLFRFVLGIESELESRGGRDKVKRRGVKSSLKQIKEIR